MVAAAEVLHEPSPIGWLRPRSPPRPANVRGHVQTAFARADLGRECRGPDGGVRLCRQGYAVTVVERMPLARVRTSGHAVDLFGPAMDVAEWTGVLSAVRCPHPD